MHLTTLSFPDITLRQSDGHKLRGYFANTFGQDSDLYHNHREDGSSIYRYPRIQFKVVDSCPMVVGLEDGAKLLIDRFLSLTEIQIMQRTYDLHQKQLQSQDVNLGVQDELFSYTLMTPWMALNQNNHTLFKKQTHEENRQLLKRILIGNILSVYKAMSHMETESILVKPSLTPIQTNFKNQPMIAFTGSFVTNAYLPDYIGLGKSVARGFGTIKQQ